MSNATRPVIFKQIGLLTNHNKELASETHTRILQWMKAHNVAVSELEFGNEHNSNDNIDLVIAIGGDGTMLHAARLAAPFNIPLVGINRGYLGFLADISPETLEVDLASIFTGNGLREKRLLLNARLYKNDQIICQDIALNDVVIKHDNSGRMMHFDTSIDSEYLTAHYGDGLIIATPTGSTAYALSCGGPILSPELPVISLTPICPHTLSDRPIVVPAASEIELKLRNLTESAVVSLDGMELGQLEDDMRLVVTASEHRLTLIHPSHYDYYAILRGKLHWGREQSR